MVREFQFPFTLSLRNAIKAIISDWSVRDMCLWFPNSPTTHTTHLHWNPLFQMFPMPHKAQKLILCWNFQKLLCPFLCILWSLLPEPLEADSSPVLLVSELVWCFWLLSVLDLYADFLQHSFRHAWRIWKKKQSSNKIFNGSACTFHKSDSRCHFCFMKH